jgi:hypothetical protein
VHRWSILVHPQPQRSTVMVVPDPRNSNVPLNDDVGSNRKKEVVVVMMIGVVGMEEEEEEMTMRFPILVTIVVVVDVVVVEEVEGTIIVTMMRGTTMVDVDISQIIVPIVGTMKSTQVIDTIIERRMNGNLCSMWTREEKKERYKSGGGWEMDI